MDTSYKAELRDKFALAAMQGMVSDGWEHKTIIAQTAYQIADAMLEERQKKEK